LSVATWRPQPAPTAEWMDWIRSAGEEDLAVLLRARPDLGFPAPRDLDELARRMVAAGSVSACYDSLDRSSRQVVAACLVSGETADVAGVAALLAADPSDLEPVLDRLARLAMVRRDGTSLHVVPSLAQVLPHPAGFGATWRALAASQQVSTLKAMAERWGVRPRDQVTKAHLLSLIERQVGDPDRVAAMMRSAPAGAARLAEQAARSGTVAVPGGPSIGYLPRENTAPGWLIAHGLIIPLSWGRAAMGREVALALRGGKIFPDFSAQPPAVVHHPADSALTDGCAVEAARLAVARVAAICRELGRAGARLLQSGGIGIRELRRVAKAVGAEVQVTARLIELAHASGLIAAGSQETVLPTRAYDDWAAKPFVDRWVDLVGGWASAMVHLSVAGAPDEKGKPYPPGGRSHPEPEAVTRRSLVLHLLERFPEGQAPSVDSVADFAQWVQPVLWQGGPADPTTLVRWFIEETDMLGLGHEGALATWGRPVVGGDLGRAASLLATHLPPVADRAVLQGDLTAVVGGEPSAELAAGLRLLADPESTGVAAVYRFSDASLRRAFDAGWNADRVLRWLEDHSLRAVPQALAYMVEDLGRRHGKARVGGSSSYLRCDDAALLAEIVGARRTASLGLRLVAPTVAIGSRPAAEVVDTLRSCGYLPVTEDSTGAVVAERPGGQRAAGPDDDDDVDLDELLREFGDEPELLAELVGVDAAGPGALLAALASAARGDDPTVEDPLSMARRLRAGPVASKPSAPPPRLFAPDDECQRPSTIVRGRDRVEALLDHAADHDWAVRLSYTNTKGATREASVEVLEIGADHAHCTVWPNGNSFSVHLGRVHWARVLTEAEEEALL
jgi:hypothetical protein